MKRYKVNVDGQDFEVAIELIDASAPPAAPKAAPVAPPAAAPVAAGAGEKVLSPMPGTILSVSVKAGAAVKKGQTLMVLEAMKMENEISAPRDGVVTSVSVSAGTAVDTDAVLCTLE